MPESVRVDISTHCQLKCPVCPTAKGIVRKDLGSGFIGMENYRRLIEENPDIRTIELSNWGEVFLHPDLVEILEFSAERNVAITLANGVNFNHVPAKVMEALVKCGVKRITFSIDGASQFTYAQYRVNGNFDRVVDNLRRLVAVKKRLHSDTPKLTWQFVAFGHNQHEVDKARELSKELGMEFLLKLNCDDKFSPLKAPQKFARMHGLVAGNRSVFKKRTGTSYLSEICEQLWNSPQINWDGRVLGCCVNTWGDFGNAFTDGLSAVIAGEKLSYAKQMLLGRQPPRTDIPCTSCDKYVRSPGTHKKNYRTVPTRLDLLNLLPKNSIGAEMGVDEGEFSKAVLRVVRPKKLYLIDSWDSERFGESKHTSVQDEFRSEINLGRIEILRGYSHQTLGQFPDHYFDWVYIDTDHTYRNTKLELEVSLRKVKKDGVIAGHDYVEGNATSGVRYGVLQAVDDFCLEHGWEIRVLTAEKHGFLSYALKQRGSEDRTMPKLRKSTWRERAVRFLVGFKSQLVAALNRDI